MASTTRVARPPAHPVGPPSITLTTLPRRQLTGVIPALLALGIATAVTGLNAVRPFTDLIPLIWIGAIALAGLSVTSGIRTFQRTGRLDPAIEAVLPLLGAPQPTRALVEAQKWTRGWVGVPARVRIRYASRVDDLDPRFVELILGAFARRIGQEYRVRKHNSRRCLLLLELAPAVDPITREQQRAHDVVKQVLDPTANVQITTGDAGAVSRIEVKHNVGPKMAVVARRMQIEKVISSMLPGRWRAQWDLERDKVVFEVRPDMPDMTLHEVEGEPDKLTHAAYKAFKIPIGPDEDGEVQNWQPSVSPHCLVIGGTGSGKTSFQHTVLTHLAHARWRVWVLDGKRIEFAGFREWPNVELVGARVEHQVRMLHAAHELMEERYTQLENGTARLEDFEPLALIIDEYATFKARVERWYKTVKPKGAPPKAPVLDLLSDLARLARSAKIHMLLGLQRPDVEFLGGEMRDNFGARVSFGRLSPQGANMMWDSFAIGVAIPRNKRGRGVTLNSQSTPVEIQAFYTPDPAKLDSTDTAEWAHLERLRPIAQDHDRRMVSEPLGAHRRRRGGPTGLLRLGRRPHRAMGSQQRPLDAARGTTHQRCLAHRSRHRPLRGERRRRTGRLSGRIRRRRRRRVRRGDRRSRGRARDRRSGANRLDTRTVGCRRSKRTRLRRRRSARRRVPRLGDRGRGAHDDLRHRSHLLPPP